MVVPMVACTGSAHNPFKSQRLAHRWSDIVARTPLSLSNYRIFWMSCFLKSSLFAKIAAICIWPQRCTRSRKVTEGGEIQNHVTKKLRKGARFHNRPCGRHAAPNITFRFPFWLFWFLSKFDSALFSYFLGLYSRELGIGDAHAPKRC